MSAYEVEASGNRPSWLPWVVCLSASLFLFYEFIQMNMFNAISHGVMSDFHINATRYGELSSAYFLANIIFLFPAGIILDRISVRRLVLITMALCIMGTYLFAFSTSYYMALFARFITGIGSAFCFLSCIRLASRWFPPKKMALASGLIVTMAMLGGMVAQTPLTLLTEAIGWRDAIKVNATIGVLFFLIIMMFVHDAPASTQEQGRHHIRQLGFWMTMRMAFISKQNWFAGIYTSLLNLPIFLLGAIWGLPYLTQVRQLSETQASYVTFMIFVGSVFGSPLLGRLSDYIGKRKTPMIWGAILSFGLVLILIYVPTLSLSMLMFIFFVLGFITSTQVLSYPVVTESNPHAVTAMSVSVISICAISGGFIFQPFFGWLMDLNWNHLIIHGVNTYAPSDYKLAMLIMPITLLLGLVAALVLKETNCQSVD